MRVFIPTPVVVVLASTSPTASDMIVGCRG